MSLRAGDSAAGGAELVHDEQTATARPRAMVTSAALGDRRVGLDVWRPTRRTAVSTGAPPRVASLPSIDDALGVLTSPDRRAARAAAERASLEAAIAALTPVIDLQLERVRALELAAAAVDAHLASDSPGRCSGWSSARPCGGDIDGRWCATCGAIEFRCREHGGAAAAAVAIATVHAVPLGHLVEGVDMAALPLRAFARAELR